LSSQWAYSVCHCRNRCLVLSVVAEGVGDEHLWAIVSAMGCDTAQGFYWARPMAAGAFAGWSREAERLAVALPTGR
jgi:EAL domain-containing protein (putative c-di-GMP-specific phosphodiesterase class I)